jgi:hypothetical protein
MTTLIIILVAVIILAGIIFAPQIFKEECKHEWGPISEGYQFCTKCNIAREVKSPECNHIWEQEHQSKIYRIDIHDRSKQNEIGTETIYICHKCTTRKFVRIELGKEALVQII